MYLKSGPELIKSKFLIIGVGSTKKNCKQWYIECIFAIQLKSGQWVIHLDAFLLSILFFEHHLVQPNRIYDADDQRHVLKNNIFEIKLVTLKALWMKNTSVIIFK